MEQRLVAKNIKLFMWYTALKEPLMWGPILITTLIHLGHMSLQEIYAMEAVVLLGKLLFEIPSGALADYIGRRRTVILGSVFHFASMAMFMTIESPTDVWIANILWVTGASLCSGADNSLLFETLKESHREHEFLKISGTAFSNRLLLTGIASLGTGFFADINLRLPLYLSIPGVLVSSIMPFFFTEPGERERKIMYRKISFRELYGLLHIVVRILNKLMKVSVLFVANNKKVKWIVGFSTLLGVSSKVWFFSYNPYFELVELDIRGYGLLFFILNMVAWYFSRHAAEIKNRLGEKRCVIVMLLCIGLPILTMGLCVVLFSASLVVLQNVTRGLSEPFFKDILHQQLTSDNRATVESVESAVSGLSQFVSLKGFEYLLLVQSLPNALVALGSLVLVLGVIGIQKYSNNFE